MAGLTTAGKVLAGVTLAGGIVWAGITFTGGDDVDSIRDSANNMAEDIQQAEADRNWLQTQFDNLKGLYTGSVEEANSTINSLNAKKLELQQQLAELEGQSAGSQEDTDAIQGEITRLESELTKANEMIATLETEITALEQENDYTALSEEDKQAMAVTEIAVVDEVGDFVTISADAEALNLTQAEAFKAQEKAVEATFSPEAQVDITGIVVHNNSIAYQVSSAINTANVAKGRNDALDGIRTELGLTGNMFFVDETGAMVLYFNQNGMNIN